MTRHPSHRHVFWLAALLVGLLGACNCNGSNGEAADQDTTKGGEATAQASAEEPADDEPAEAAEAAEAPPADIYPDFNFGALRPEERKKFVKIAEAELCPCPEATASLHACLQDRQERCGLSMHVAALVAGGIREGYSETDILDKVAEFVDQAKTSYEFTLEGVPHQGGPVDAPVVLVEFADFQCPHCKEAAQMLPEVLEGFGDKVVMYYKHFPLSSHTASELAARASLAAHRQGKFWPMHDLLFEHQRTLSESKIKGFARQLGLNYQKFERDLASPEIAAAVQRDRKEAMDAGVTGTPALFINGRRYLGEKTPEQITAAIEAELASDDG